MEYKIGDELYYVIRSRHLKETVTYRIIRFYDVLLGGMWECEAEVTRHPDIDYIGTKDNLRKLSDRNVWIPYDEVLIKQEVAEVIDG